MSVNTTALAESVAKLEAEPAYFLAKTADVLWLLVCGFLVFFMQCGFALLEAGTVRAKNTKNILLKNLLDACVGALIWWSVGFLIAVRARTFRACRSPPASGPQVTPTRKSRRLWVPRPERP